MSLKQVGVIGAGVIGSGVAIDLLLHGVKTVVVDNSQKALDDCERSITETIRFAPILTKRKNRYSLEETLGLVRYTSELNDLKNGDFIIENVTENWTIKQEVYRELNQFCRPETRIGVNTSCISITKVGSLLKKPENIIGIHFMNPVYLKPVVEVITGELTSEETIEITKELLTSLDKEGIIVNDMPGFVSNRISHLFMNEAAFVLQDQVSTAKDIDNIFKKCFGTKWVL